MPSADAVYRAVLAALDAQYPRLARKVRHNSATVRAMIREALPPSTKILVGLPYSAGGHLARTVSGIGAPTLISAGSLYRPERGWNIGDAAWTTGAALDCGGFTAMRLHGGYRWTPEEYVDAVVTNAGRGERPFPWSWWAAPDYCCEPEIAEDRAEVERRMDATLRSYGETLDALQAWREEGISDVPDPMPVLQGRTPADYVDSARRMAAVIDAHHPCVCPRGAECGAQWHRAHCGLPDLVGVGSVCRRNLHGADGLLAVLDALDAHLPRRVKLHLFGVKGAALQHIAKYGDRVASIDSMAWDFAARQDANKLRKRGINVVNDVEFRGQRLTDWYRAQQQAARG